MENKVSWSKNQENFYLTVIDILSFLVSYNLKLNDSLPSIGIKFNETPYYPERRWLLY